MASLSQLLGTFMGPMGTVIGMGDGRPDNTLSDMQSLTRAHAEARAKRLAAAQGSLGSPAAPIIHPMTNSAPAPAGPAPSPPISGISPGFQNSPPAAPAQSAPQMPWWASGDLSKMPGAAPQAPSPAPAPAPVSAPQTAPVPMPQARPADAPQAPPDTGFFMRNAMMQRDPMTGQLLDPSASSSVSGPDLISKMMTYLHGKASA
jgi:hypothetical protein